MSGVTVTLLSGDAGASGEVLVFSAADGRAGVRFPFGGLFLAESTGIAELWPGRRGAAEPPESAF